MPRFFMFALLALCLPAAGCGDFVSEANNLGPIWVIGDSIVQGNDDGDTSGSTPRSELNELLGNAGYNFSFTGHSTANPEDLPVTGGTINTNLYQYHSGISGHEISQMDDRLAGDWANSSSRLSVVTPNVVLIMLGTNDIDRDVDVANAPDRLNEYINNIYGQPGVGNPVVFVSNIPPNRTAGGSKSGRVDDFNAAIPGVVKIQQGLGRSVFFVDQFTPLNDNFDRFMIAESNLHTNAAGNASLARQWFNGIDSRVNALAEPCTSCIW